MKTLQELIDDGLPVGALVKFYNRTYQFVLNGTTPLFQDLDSFTGYKVSPALDEIGWQPTTAYDSDIDPEKLPIEEPFWTGFAMWKKLGPFKIITNLESSKYIKLEDNEDGWRESYLKANCKPCLPPA